MRPNCKDEEQTVQDDDAYQVTADSDTADAQPLSVVGVDPELGFAGGETQVLALTLALAGAGNRAELICDPAGRLWERATAARINVIRFISATQSTFQPGSGCARFSSANATMSF